MHAQEQLPTHHNEKLLINTGKLVIDRARDTNLSFAEKPHNALQRQENDVMDDIAVEDQAAAHGFSFSRGQKLVSKIT